MTKTVLLDDQKAYRLINSKFPPETLFDDVADADEFDAVYAIQALTNPRLQNEIGDLNLLPRDNIPFGIEGVNYVTAPFTHTNPDGSRFSDGTYGVLYLADHINTAIAETRYHQEKYFQNIPDLHFDTVTMRGIVVHFSGRLVDARDNSDIHIPDNYVHAIEFAKEQRKAGALGIQYNSVRAEHSLCWALFTPKFIHSAIQTQHFEFVYNGKRIDTVRQVTLLT